MRELRKSKFIKENYIANHKLECQWIACCPP